MKAIMTAKVAIIAAVILATGVKDATTTTRMDSVPITAVIVTMVASATRTVSTCLDWTTTAGAETAKGGTIERKSVRETAGASTATGDATMMAVIAAMVNTDVVGAAAAVAVSIVSFQMSRPFAVPCFRIRPTVMIGTTKTIIARTGASATTSIASARGVMTGVTRAVIVKTDVSAITSTASVIDAMTGVTRIATVKTAASATINIASAMDVTMDMHSMTNVVVIVVIQITADGVLQNVRYHLTLIAYVCHHPVPAPTATPRHATTTRGVGDATEGATFR